MHVTSFRVGITETVGEGRSPSYAKAELEVSVYPGESYEDAKKEALTELKNIQRELQSQVGGGAKPEKKVAPKKKEETKTAEKSEAKAEQDGKGAAERSEKEAPKKEAPQPAKKKAPRKKPAVKEKATPYNRENREHKNVVRGILNEHFEGWKEDQDMAAMAKLSSVELDGSDLLDADGNILDSFVEALKEKMTADADV